MHDNQLNHHKQGLFGLKLCSQTMNFSPVGCNVKCQVLIVVFVGFGCQLGYMIYISRQSTKPSCTQIRQVLVIFFSLDMGITNRASFVMIEQVCLLRMIKVFIYPTVSYGSLGKGVMLIPLALGDARLNENL